MDSQETSFKLICDPLAITSKKIEIAARYAGMQLTIVEFDPNTANEATLKEFLKKSPDGLTPVLETPEGCLFEANAILRFVGRYNDNSKLYGDSFFEKAMVDQFLDWSTLTLEPIYAQYVLPYLGYTVYDKKAHEQSFKAYKEVLAVLEEQLKKSKYVVGNNITLPDIQIVSLLHFNYRYNFDEKTRKAFPNLTKYFESVAAEDNFKRFLGKAFLCKTPLQPHKMKK